MLLVISLWNCQRWSISSHVSQFVYGWRWIDVTSDVSLFSQVAKGHYKYYLVGNQLDGCHLWRWYLPIAIGCDLLPESSTQAMVVLCEKDTLWRRVRAAPMKKTCYDLLQWKRHAMTCFYECLNLLHRYFQRISGKTCQGTLCSCIISFWWLATNKFLFCHGVEKCLKRNNLRAKMSGKSQERIKGNWGGEGSTEERK